MWYRKFTSLFFFLYCISSLPLPLLCQYLYRWNFEKLWNKHDPFPSLHCFVSSFIILLCYAQLIFGFFINTWDNASFNQLLMMLPLIVLRILKKKTLFKTYLLHSFLWETGWWLGVAAATGRVTSLLLLLLLLLLLVSDVLEESCPSLSVTMLRRRLVPF